MPVAKKIIVDDGIVGLFKMTETIGELESKYFSYFREVPAISGFQHDRRKKEWLSIRILIAELIGRNFNIEYSDDGSPQLSHPEFHYISISHSAMYAAVYLHKNKKAGLDVESLSRNFVSIEKKYLSPEELEQAMENELLHAIYWCCKEAVFKWAGREGVDFRKQIKIGKFNPDETNVIYAVFHNQDEQQVKLSFDIVEGNVLVYTI